MMLETGFPGLSNHEFLQLLSVISMLSSDSPNTDSPANVDAAKQVRGEIGHDANMSIASLNLVS